MLTEKLLDPDHQTYHTASQLILELNQISSCQRTQVQKTDKGLISDVFK